MRAGSSFVGVVGLALAVVLGCTDTALADARSEARRHYRHGMELAQSGRYEEGIAEMREAYAILPHPNVLYNIARTYALAGELEQAREHFDRYLESDPPDRAEVELILRDLDEAERARTRGAGDSGAQPPPPRTPPRTEVVGTPSRSDNAERIRALRSAAAEIRATAEALRSEVLAEQAAELDLSADALERADAAASSTVAEDSPEDDGQSVSVETIEGPQEPTETSTESETAVSEQSSVALTVAEATESSEEVYEQSIVSASRSRLSALDAPVSVEVITRQDIRLSGITHLGELLRRVAGVQVASTTPFDADVGIRGFNRLLNPRVLMLVNGRSTYFDAIGLTFWGAQPFAVEDIERIEVIRGPASVLHGANGFTGVVNVILREPGADPGAEVRIGFGNGGQARIATSISARTGNLAYRATAGYTQYDNYGLPQDPERVDIENPVRRLSLGGQIVHAGGQLHWRASDRLQLSVEGGVAYMARISYVALAGLDQGHMSGPHAYGMATLQHRSGYVRAYWNHGENDPTPFDERIPGFTMLLDVVNLETDYNRRFRLLEMDHDLHLGGSYRFKRLVSGGLGGEHQEHHFAAYFEDNVRFTEKLRGVVALRMDHHPLLDREVFSPRVGVIVRPSPDRSIRLTTTTAFRTPAMGDTYATLTLPTGISAVNGLNLGTVFAETSPRPGTTRPERIIAVEAGYVDQHFDELNFEVNAYYNQVFSLLEFSPTPYRFTLADYANPEYSRYATFNPGVDAFIAGMGAIRSSAATYHSMGGEAILRSNPIDGLDLSLGYALNVTFVEDSDYAESRDFRAPVNSLHAGVQYRSPIGIDASADVYYSGKTLWPELRSSAEGIVRQNMELPAYLLANVRVGYRLPGDKLDLALVGSNLATRPFREHPLGQLVTPRVLLTMSARF